jgi:hypothetical protein
MMDMISAAQGAIDESTLLKTVAVAAELPLRQLPMAMSCGGEITPESRGLTSGRAAQTLPYHNVGADGSRFADRNLGGDVCNQIRLNSLDGSCALCRCMHRQRPAIFTKCCNEAQRVANLLSGCIVD